MNRIGGRTTYNLLLTTSDFYHLSSSYNNNNFSQLLLLQHCLQLLPLLLLLLLLNTTPISAAAVAVAIPLLLPLLLLLLTQQLQQLSWPLITIGIACLVSFAVRIFVAITAQMWPAVARLAKGVHKTIFSIWSFLQKIRDLRRAKIVVNWLWNVMEIKYIWYMRLLDMK